MAVKIIMAAVVTVAVVLLVGFVVGVLKLYDLAKYITDEFEKRG